MCLEKNYKTIIKYLLLISTLLITMIASINGYAATKDDSVNVLTWWGYLDSPEIEKEVKDQCNVNLSHDTYYTNNEFMRREKTNKANYDIIIFSQTIYDLIKDQIPKNNANLAVFANKFHPVIRKEYQQEKFPHNVIYFMHSLSGFLWNPNVIILSDTDTIDDIFKKANKNIVVLIDDPVEIWNLINKAYSTKNQITIKNDNQTVPLNLENFKRLTQNTTVYTANNYNQIYDQKDFAFAFGWSGDAIVYMKQAKKSFKFLIHPKLSYISSDLLAAMNDKPNTMCVAKVLMSKKVLDIVQNNTYYFSPYGDYTAIKLPIYQSIYREAFTKLSEIPWLESHLSPSDFQKMADAWNNIQLNIHNN